MSDRVFIYWDNSNIFHEAQHIAKARNRDPDAGQRVRIHFANLLRLAQADRKLGRMVAAGSVPKEMRQLWSRMENIGVEVKLFDRGERHRSEQDIPDMMLQLAMLEACLGNLDRPGTIALLTGDGGTGYYPDSGFHRNLERMHKHGWRVEVLSWEHACKRRMRAWVEENGVFVALDDFYDSITFLEPSRRGHPPAASRDAAPLDLTHRKTA